MHILNHVKILAMEIIERDCLLAIQFPDYFVYTDHAPSISKSDKATLINELITFGESIKDINLNVIKPMKIITLNPLA
jgi:hypothetical protein